MSEVAAKKSRRSIGGVEIALIKAMLRRGMDKTTIQSYFTHPDRSVNYGRITNIEQGTYGPDVVAAEDAEFRISKPYRERVKWIAAYRIRPIQAVTHIAPIARLESSPSTDGYWMAVFAEPARQLERPIPQGDAGYRLMQGPRYTNKDGLLVAPTLADRLASEEELA